MEYDEEVVRRVLEVSESEELKAPETTEVFEKFVTKKLKESMQRYTYIRLIDFEHYESIFTKDVDPEVFLTIIQTFTEQIINNKTFNVPQEQEFIAKFMICIAKSPSFDFMLDFMDDKDREKIKYVIDNLD